MATVPSGSLEPLESKKTRKGAVPLKTLAFSTALGALLATGAACTVITVWAWAVAP